MTTRHDEREHYHGPHSWPPPRREAVNNRRDDHDPHPNPHPDPHPEPPPPAPVPTPTPEPWVPQPPPVPAPTLPPEPQDAVVPAPGHQPRKRLPLVQTGHLMFEQDRVGVFIRGEDCVTIGPTEISELLRMANSESINWDKVQHARSWPECEE